MLRPQMQVMTRIDGKIKTINMTQPQVLAIMEKSQNFIEYEGFYTITCLSVGEDGRRYWIALDKTLHQSIIEAIELKVKTKGY